MFCLYLTAAYIKQCARDDPKLVDCFIGALEHLRPYLANGIPEIEVGNPSVFSLKRVRLFALVLRKRVAVAVA